MYKGALINTVGKHSIFRKSEVLTSKGKKAAFVYHTNFPKKPYEAETWQLAL